MKKQLATRLAALHAGAIVFAGQAYAAVPTEVTTAIEEGMADGKTIAYALLTFAVAVGVILFIKRKAG